MIRNYFQILTRNKIIFIESRRSKSNAKIYDKSLKWRLQKVNALRYQNEIKYSILFDYPIKQLLN